MEGEKGVQESAKGGGEGEEEAGMEENWGCWCFRSDLRMSPCFRACWGKSCRSRG